MAFSVSFREGRQGRKVRIVKRRLSPAAAISLAAVAVTSVFSFAAWRWWNADAIPISAPLILEDNELEWKCDQGHVFLSQGQVGGQPCPTCREMSYPFTNYHCAAHGKYEVKVQFGRFEDGRARPVLFRVGNGPWAAAENGPKCPRCEQPMSYKQADPLDGLVKPKRKTSAP